MDSDIPLLGVNLGTLGYLAEVEIGNIEQALSSLVQSGAGRSRSEDMEKLITCVVEEAHGALDEAK